MSKERSLKLTSLELNTENPRFDVLAGQKEAIDKMIEDQGENLYNLADHILKNNFNPIDKVLVVPSKSSNRYTVVEGNRRVASLKIASNPELIEDHDKTALKRKFTNLHNNNEQKFPLTIPCLILEDTKEAELWIGLKHSGLQNGVGTDAWDSIQKQRYEEKTKGKSSLALQLINFLKVSDHIPNELKENIDSIKTTNVDRLLGDPYVRTRLGVEFTNGILTSNLEEKEVAKGLAKVAMDLLERDFTVSRIYDADKRKAYIESFGSRHKVDTSKKASHHWQLNAIRNKPSPTQQSAALRPSQANKQRTKLIPRKVPIKISQPRLEAIFKELQTLDVMKHKNAVAVLFRVFLELSLDFYIEQKKLTQGASTQRSGLSLREKAFQVISHLTNRNILDAAISKGIRNAVKDDNSILGTETWHAYVHNHRFSPIPQNMLLTWDSMQQFITLLWNDLA